MDPQDVRSHEIQREIRNSAEDLKEYMTELKRWETDIKRKDRELLRQKEEQHKTVDEIPVLEGKEEIEKQIRMQKAELEKEKGNVFLKANILDKAIECYTSGLTLDPYNPLIHANRALALLKKEHYATAEKDCDEAIKLDPKYVKAYLRRAASRSALGKLSGAKDDLLEVLRLEPNNPQAKQELLKVEKGLLNEQNQSGSGAGTLVPVTPIDKPEHLRSKVPLRRIKVVPISDDSESCLAVDARPENGVRRCHPPPAPIVDSIKPKVLKLNISDLTSYQFQKEFRRMKDHSELFYGYIKQIPAEKYPQLFQHSLESDVLSHLLLSYRDFFLPNGDDVYQLLLHLSKTKRFTTIRMFFSADDKQVLCDLFDKLQETNSKDSVESLRSVYGMS